MKMHVSVPDLIILGILPFSNKQAALVEYIPFIILYMYAELHFCHINIEWSSYTLALRKKITK